jgi:hypothetical protein
MTWGGGISLVADNPTAAFVPIAVLWAIMCDPSGVNKSALVNSRPAPYGAASE